MNEQDMVSSREADKNRFFGETRAILRNMACVRV